MTPNYELIQYGCGETDTNKLHAIYYKLNRYCMYGVKSLEENVDFSYFKTKYPGLFELASNKINGIHKINHDENWRWKP